MSERRLQGKTVPVRVRFRSPAEQNHSERDLPASHATTSQAQIAAPVKRRAEQLRELLRLSELLRADLVLDEVLQQIATSTAQCLGFRVLVINLIEESNPYLKRAAFVGVSPEQQRMLHDLPRTVSSFLNAMRPEFRVSQSYFIPHQSESALALQNGSHFVHKSMDSYEPGGWHPEDALQGQLENAP